MAAPIKLNNKNFGKSILTIPARIVTKVRMIGKNLPAMKAIMPYRL